MTTTVHEITQRVMNDPRYQNPQVQSDFVALLGQIGELLRIAGDTEGLRALANQLEIARANQPQPQWWAVQWLDADGKEQHVFEEHQHMAELVYERLDANGVETIEMSQIFLVKEKKKES